jgi:hypothetical protein
MKIKQLKKKEENYNSGQLKIKFITYINTYAHAYINMYTLKSNNIIEKKNIIIIIV